MGFVTKHSISKQFWTFGGLTDEGDFRPHTSVQRKAIPCRDKDNAITLAKAYGETHVAVGCNITQTTFCPMSEMITCPKWKGEAVIEVKE
jgi:hypothetical protein